MDNEPNAGNATVAIKNGETCLCERCRGFLEANNERGRIVPATMAEPDHEDWNYPGSELSDDYGSQWLLYILHDSVEDMRASETKGCIMCTPILREIEEELSFYDDGKDPVPKPREGLRKGDRAYSRERKGITEKKLASEAQAQACIEWLFSDFVRAQRYKLDQVLRPAHDLDGRIVLLLRLEANIKPLQLVAKHKLHIFVPSITMPVYDDHLFLWISQGRCIPSPESISVSNQLVADLSTLTYLIVHHEMYSQTVTWVSSGNGEMIV